MDINVIKAVILYRDALQENQAELLVSLEDCSVVYVPNMPHSHRSYWTEANMFIFYKPKTSDNIDGDYLCVSNSSDGTRRGLWFVITENDDFNYCIAKIACDNLQIPYSNQIHPSFIEISPQLILKTINLLAFV